MTTLSQGDDKWASKIELKASMTYLQALLHSLEIQGVNSEELLKSANLPLMLLQQRNATIPYEKCIELWQLALKKTANPELGLVVGKEFHIDAYGPLSSLLMACPNMWEGARQILKYQYLLQTGTQTLLNVDGDLAYMETLNQHFDSELMRPIIEYELADALNVARFIAQTSHMQDRQPSEVWFRHSAPESTVSYEKFFQAPVKFSQVANRIYFNKSYLKVPSRFPNEQLMTQVVEFIESKHDDNNDLPLVVQVQRYISKNMQEGVPEITSVSAHFDLTLRTFQRRLKESGYTYNALSQQVRQDTALELLKGNVPIKTIALTLGFSESNAFNQAFKKWTGETPGEYKKSLNK